MLRKPRSHIRHKEVDQGDCVNGGAEDADGVVIFDEAAQAEEQSEGDEDDGQNARLIFQVPHAESDDEVEDGEQQEDNAERGAESGGKAFQEVALGHGGEQAHPRWLKPMTLKPARDQSAPRTQVSAAMIETPRGRTVFSSRSGGM